MINPFINTSPNLPGSPGKVYTVPANRQVQIMAAVVDNETATPQKFTIVFSAAGGTVASFPHRPTVVRELSVPARTTMQVDTLLGLGLGANNEIWASSTLANGLRLRLTFAQYEV